MNPSAKNASVSGTAYRCGAVAAVVACAALVSCSGSEPSPPADDTRAASGLGERTDEQVQLSIDGRDEPMHAQARLSVTEGMQEVSFNITGGDAADNFVVIDLAFAGVESVLGLHSIELEPAGIEGPHAVASLDGQVYDTARGQVELTLSKDGGVQGSFEIGLVVADLDGSRAAAGAAPSDGATSISGVFSGGWIVACVSPIRGFTGGHAVADSPYCNSLEF